jgi:uncharacterized protein (DUF2235 family)
VKRIIICADGTWNTPDQQANDKHRHATNVTKVARAILPRSSKGIDQVVIYHNGVGTEKGIQHVLGGAAGEGIEEIVRDLYRSIAYNYVEGDEIYLFGFSRGAFTVRTLAGFMYHFHLLHKCDDFFVPDLFKAYEASKDLAAVQADPAFRNLHEVKPTPPIRFVGVWDTVGALGAPGPVGDLINGNRFTYHDIDLNPNVQNAYHAVAIDEQRLPFKPSFWTRPETWQGTLEQTWFCGVHCNVGGGYSPDGLANEALHWLVEKAASYGLEFDSDYLSYFRPCFNSTLSDSMSLLYEAFGKYHRPIGEHRAHGEQIHQSVIDRMNLASMSYAPPNLPRTLIEGTTALPIVNTSRIARGSPCGPAEESPTSPR